MGFLNPHATSVCIVFMFIFVGFTYFSSNRHSKWHNRLASQLRKKVIQYEQHKPHVQELNFGRQHQKKGGNRRVALWIVREEKDQIAVLLQRSEKEIYQVVQEQLNFMETAYTKCETILKSLGLNIEQVEFLKAVKKNHKREE